MPVSVGALWVGLMLLSLPVPIILSCITGKADVCKDLEFAPGSNLAGEGFDITKMQRKGAYVIDVSSWMLQDKKCMICNNPYLGRKEKLPVSVVDWRPNHQCNMKVSSSIHESSESLVTSSSNNVENNWQVNLDVQDKRGEGKLMLAGTQSNLAQYSMEKTKKDRFSFTSHQVSCSYYSYRISNQPRLHSEFQHAVKKLPKKYNRKSKHRYYKFIDIFGTHYITKVRLGGSVSSVTSIRQCEAALQGLSVEEVKTCLDVEAAASVGQRLNVNTNYKHCEEDKKQMENKASFSSKFNDRFTEIRGGHTTEPELLFSDQKNPTAYKEWMTSLATTPDLVSYSLDSLHELLPDSEPKAEHLQNAISHYILEHSLWKNCSEPCPMGVKTHPKDSCICACHNNPGVTPSCCPSKRGLARVKVTVQRGSGLWGDYDTGTDGYVKVFSLGVPAGRSPVIYNNNHPTWNYMLDMGMLVLSMENNLRFEVWDEDNKWDDDQLGACDVKLTAGVKEDLCTLNHGQLYYKMEVECAPNLGGESCHDYVESPMNLQLKKSYVSRNARPVPKEILTKMGVLLDTHYNTSLATQTDFYGSSYK
uniref:Perforin 1.9 n=1 Tax=Paramormyrops kingsleyae TaxID=1676925 RepID=A0A3B3TB64_9TELE|nr:perforin-1-like [Paramormyrops kingsleyae]XP_023677912.1 perforin-1-like [Paramormyrops kingsleyae]